VSPPKLLVASYALGVALFLAGLIFLALKLLSVVDFNAGILLLAGFVLMFGSKFVIRAVLKGSER